MSVFDRPHTTPPPEDPYNGMSDRDREIAYRLRIVEDRQLVISGADGTNGKLGNLRKDVDSHGSLIKWLGGAVAASVVTAVTAIYGAGVKDGANKQEMQYLRNAVEELRAQMRDQRGYRAPSWPTPTGDDR